MNVKNAVLKILALTGVVLVAGPVHAQTVNVTSDIAVSTTWTATNTYNLQQQIYVLPGATLTIEAGTVIASTTNLGGSLAVCRGAQIFVRGTQAKPVIMTSLADVATWAADPGQPNGKNPQTGTWRVGANEWGNLTIMGGAYISEDAIASNTAAPNPANYGTMEGLTQSGPSDTRTFYGGGDDYDDSGTVAYLSLRYGGKVIGLNNELNGMSLGGIGRGTTIHHVEVMNNVDDGFEIWGGTVNLKYVSIWNVGDDSFDVDQGWRGKAQFGLLVQGYSANAAQGSGLGDNMFETDGAENSYYQPVTTASIWNFTCIGQPGGGNAGGDHATAWRDNARVQYHGCIFMDVGERVVSFDNLDGDGAAGYAANGTLAWANTWTTPYTTTSTVNAPVNPGAFYTAQASGNLAEITDSIFFHNTFATAYTEAIARGVFGAGTNNLQEPASSPITALTRSGPVLVTGALTVQPVSFLNPLPANDALTSATSAPNDGFFKPANYRGAFAPGINWLCGWTASQAFGLTPAPTPGPGQPGVAGASMMDVNAAVNANGCGVGVPGDLRGPFFTTVTSGTSLNFTFNGEPNRAILLASGAILNPANFDLVNFGLPGAGLIDVGTVVPFAVTFLADGTQPDFLNSLFNTGPTGTMNVSLPANFPVGATFNLQAIIFNSSTFLRTSNAVRVTIN